VHLEFGGFEVLRALFGMLRDVVLLVFCVLVFWGVCWGAFGALGGVGVGFVWVCGGWVRCVGLFLRVLEGFWLVGFWCGFGCLWLFGMWLGGVLGGGVWLWGGGDVLVVGLCLLLV